jgi:pSer/pThr/pTyr-binding forkhead associated (FHA) protein
VGRLRQLPSGPVVVLQARCLVGRSAACNLRVHDRFVSSEHAKLGWTGSEWLLRDLGSRNGTFVDGERLRPAEPVALKAGSELGFGSPEAGWRLIDDGPPVALATDLMTGAVVTAVGDLLVLPDDVNPELSVFRSNQADVWMTESRDGDRERVEDQAVVRVGDRAFRLDLPVADDATPVVQLAMNLDTVDLRFGVPLNEERVELSVLLHGVETKLEAREHGYFLLTLARARAEDAGRPPEERGWRTNEQLSRMLRLDANALRVSTHRARQQLASIGLDGAVGIVEVERGKKRLGTDRFEIVRIDE